MSNDRKEIITLVEEAVNAGARQSLACETLGVSTRTLQRWGQPDHECDRRLFANTPPLNKLSDAERQEILRVSNEPAYAHLPPNKIVPLLADEGRYIASESTFYRVLHANNQLAHRQSSKPSSPLNRPDALTATAPNQLYSWDITYLPTTVKGIFFYLYLVLDIYSRKIVGWQVYEAESSALAADLMTDICQREGIKRNQVTLHSDNGSPMKGATLLATLQELGMMTSFSRPSVSNDNPYSESLFRTLKYRPEYPNKAFTNLAAARDWVQGFVGWYNDEHLHSCIRFVTPSQRHAGEDIAILAKRKEVYEQAKLKHPERWSGETRNWDHISEVHLNPQKSTDTSRECQAA